MAEATQESPLTAKAVTDLIAAALKPVAESLAPIVQNQKVIADTMAADTKARADAAKPAATTATAAAQQSPLTAEAVAKMLTDTMAARDAAAQSNAARSSFIADKLKGVPVVYHGKLGTDPAKWPAEEQSIRDGFKADLSAIGLKAPDVSGAAGASGSAASAGTPEAAARASLYRNLTPGQAAFAESLVLPK